MRKAAVLLVAVMLAACTQATGRPTPSLSTSPNRLAGLSCRLPIVTPDGRGAFISFPSATVSFDPIGTVPQGHGGVYYDVAASRWLPVNRSAVSSSGARYAYLEWKVPGTPGRARLHVVDVSSGNDRLYEFGTDGSAYVIVDFATEGIWLSYAGYEGPRGGLLLLDLATGVLKDSGVPGIFDPVSGGGGVFWFTDPGQNPQTNSTGMGYIILARLQRLTISDGKSETWFSKPGSSLMVLGTDLAGHPIFFLWANSDIRSIWVALSPNEAKEIGLPQGDYQLITDSHGAWFGGPQGVYLYSDVGGLQKVSDQPGYAANGCI